MSESWANLRQGVLDRDGHECRFCGMSDEKHKEATGRGLEAHHIIPRSDGGADVVENLVTLCRSCHQTMENLHAEAMGQIKTEDDYSDDLAEITWLYDEYYSIAAELEELLAEFIDGHPTFARELRFYDEMQGEGTPSMVSQAVGEVFPSPPQGDPINISSEWRAAAAYGYKTGVMNVLIDITSRSSLPIEEYREEDA